MFLNTLQIMKKLFILVAFKKNILPLLCVLFIAAVAVFMTIDTHSPKDELLMENLAALATPWECEDCGLDPCICPDGDDGATKYDDVICGTIKYTDPDNGDIIEMKTKICTGNGNRKCKCPN